MERILTVGGNKATRPISDLLSRYFKVVADMTNVIWNTVAAHEIAVVTGAVQMLILPQCTGTLVGAGTLTLGDETTADSIIASSVAPSLALGEWWADATMTRTLLTRTLMNGLDIVVANGKDIGYTVGAAALTAGSITFHIWWSPISTDGFVVAGAGGTF